MSEVTRILNQIEAGDLSAANELLPLVYSELHRLATHRMGRESAAQTLQPTALVHEAYVRLVGDGPTQWNSRGHFFAAAAEAMRRILVESSRRRKAKKRGGDLARYEISENDAVLNLSNLDELLDLDAALRRLAAAEPELSKLVELRYFAGLSVAETAEVMGISTRTVKRNWAFARAWLGREMNPSSENP